MSLSFLIIYTQPPIHRQGCAFVQKIIMRCGHKTAIFCALEQNTNRSNTIHIPACAWDALLRRKMSHVIFCRKEGTM
jgi:hypothetical protein